MKFGVVAGAGVIAAIIFCVVYIVARLGIGDGVGRFVGVARDNSGSGTGFGRFSRYHFNNLHPSYYYVIYS